MATILVVDDEPPLRRMFELLLTQSGHAVLTAYDAREAWRLMRGARPDLLICDHSMEGTTGGDFCGLVRRTPEFATVPIMLCSALQEHTIAGTSVYDAFLPKPFATDTLLELVERLLKPRDLARGQ